MIEQRAKDARIAIQLRGAEESRQLIEQQGEMEAAARKKLEEEQKQARDFAIGLRVDGDPIAKLQLDLEAKSALLAQYAAKDQDNLELFAYAKLALEEQTAAQIKQIRR